MSKRKRLQKQILDCTLCERGVSKLTSKSYLALLDKNMREITIGIDEVGYGSMFGPMIVAGCANPTGWFLPGIRDSKKVKKESDRKAFADEIRHNCVFTFSIIGPTVINIYGITRCLQMANRKIREQLVSEIRKTFGDSTPIKVVLDGEDKVAKETIDGVEVHHIKHADADVYEVSCASIIAKSIHDQQIHELSQDSRYALYEIAKHKGYGVPRHKELVLEYGLSDQHRTKHCASWLKDKNNEAHPATPKETNVRPGRGSQLHPSQRSVYP